MSLNNWTNRTETELVTAVIRARHERIARAESLGLAAKHEAEASEALALRQAADRRHAAEAEIDRVFTGRTNTARPETSHLDEVHEEWFFTANVPGHLVLVRVKREQDNHGTEGSTWVAEVVESNPLGVGHHLAS